MYTPYYNIPPPMFPFPWMFGGNNGGVGNSISELEKLLEFMKKQEENKKKDGGDKDKKPPRKPADVIGAFILLMLLTPVVGTAYFYINLWLFKQMAMAVQALGLK